MTIRTDTTLSVRPDRRLIRPTSHSTRFVLVDARRRIRGYYRMGDEDLVERVVEDARGLR